MTYRVYFNRERDWPQCWSIDTGSQADEINVCDVVLVGIDAVSRVLPVERRGAREKCPYAWLEVEGTRVVHGGVAYFYGCWFDRVVDWFRRRRSTADRRTAA